MSLHKAKPTSAGRRFVVSVKTQGLHKGKPLDALLDK
jgi:large subunit ribosomal protein L2